MHGIEVRLDESILALYPSEGNHSRVCSAHEPLPDDINAVLVVSLVKCEDTLVLGKIVVEVLDMMISPEGVEAM